MFSYIHGLLRPGPQFQIPLSNMFLDAHFCTHDFLGDIRERTLGHVRISGDFIENFLKVSKH